MQPIPRTISLLDQILSSVTHGVGFVLALFALIIPLFFGHFPSHQQFVAYIIFASSLVFLYLCSSLYHAFEHTRAERVFISLDHSGIFALIAGTYTPLILIAESGWRAVIFLSIIWTIAIVGTVLKAIWPHRLMHLFTTLYVSMGWLALFIIHDIAVKAPHGTVLLLILGGIAYSIGTYFFVHRHLPLRHTIWHLFVMAGSAFHFVAIIKL